MLDPLLITTIFSATQRCRDYFLGGIKLDRVAVEKDLGILISQFQR